MSATKKRAPKSNGIVIGQGPEPLGSIVYGIADSGIDTVNKLAGLVADVLQHVDASDRELLDVLMLLGQAHASFDAIVLEVHGEAEKDERLAAYLKHGEDPEDVYRRLHDVEARYRALGGDKAYDEKVRLDIVRSAETLAKNYAEVPS